MTKLKRKQLALNIENAPDGEYGLPGKNIPDVREGDVLEEAIDKIIETLDKLSPATPPSLDLLSLSLSEGLTGPVNAKLAFTGTTAYNIFKFSNNSYLTYRTTGNPLNVLNRDGHFKFDESADARLRFRHEYNGNTKTVEINYFDQLTTPPQDNVQLITDSTNNFNITIDIAEFRDFYADDPDLSATSSNFYNSVKSVSSVQLATTYNANDRYEREVYLEYSQKGDFSDAIVVGNAPLKYRIEGNETPIVSNTPSYSFISPMVSYVSGVPTFQTGDTLKIIADIDNSVKYYYPYRAARTTVTATNAVNYTLSGTYIEYSTITIENTHTILNNQYYETINGSVTPYDIFSSGSAANASTLTNYRVDTKSLARAAADVNKRLQSPIDNVDPSTPWTTPLSSSSAYYDMVAHQNSLDDSNGVYRHALQVRNGLYEYPAAVNYSNYIDGNGDPGPDYTNTNGNFPASDWRYIDIKIGSINNITSLKLNFGGATWNSKQPDGLIILLRVDGSAPTGGDGWLNCMAAYGGSGNPTGTDDPVGPSTARDAYVINSPDSTNNGRIRYITFGSDPKIGDVIVRVGIRQGTSNRFATITIT